MSVSTANTILSALTILGQVIIILGAVGLLWRREWMRARLGANTLLLGLVAALIATFGSLYYSEVAGFEPCTLCWYQRIAMYPQIVLLGVAIWRQRETAVRLASLILAGIGALIAGYQYLMQIGVIPVTSCSALEYSVSCADNFSMNFGYITIPLMAFTAFGVIIVSLVTAGVSGKSNKSQEA